jgi:hypothetical protein
LKNLSVRNLLERTWGRRLLNDSAAKLMKGS